MSNPIRGTAVYADSYDYADNSTQTVNDNPPESTDLGDSGGLYLDGDGYTEIFAEEDYYESSEDLPSAAPNQDVAELNEDELAVDDGEAQKALMEQMAKLEEQIKSSEYPASTKQDLSAQLERARATLELNPQQPEAAEEAFLHIQEQFNEFSRHTPAAIEMAANFGKSVDEIESAAQDAGLKIDSLPQPPDEKVMRFLNSLGIPGDQKSEQFKILKDLRTQNMRALKSSLEAQSQLPDSDGNLPYDQNDLNQTELYRTLQDSEYQQMMGAVGDMQAPILEGLKAMGYQASAGAKPDQIVVGGLRVDFFDENMGTLTLSSEATGLTQNENEFFVIPEEVDTDAPAWLDAGGRIVGGVLGACAGSIICGTIFPPGGSLVGGAVGAYVGQELGHQIVQGLHDFCEDLNPFD